MILSGACVAANISSWKKVSIVFLPIRFLSFDAARRYLSRCFPSLSRLWDFIRLLMRKYIRHCSLDSCLVRKGKAMPQINLLYNKKNKALIEIRTIFDVQDAAPFIDTGVCLLHLYWSEKIYYLVTKVVCQDNHNKRFMFTNFKGGNSHWLFFLYTREWITN